MNFRYVDNKTKNISFPIGGIGTGCIGLAGNGRFIDMEIFNKPNKGSNSGFTHFAIKAEDEHEVVDARVLNSDLPPDYIGGFERPRFQGFGFGPDRPHMTGVPHFKKSEFIGTFPVAKINFIDDSFPGKVSLKAFNPFVPTNEDDSSIPAAFFEINVTNVTKKELTYTIGFSCNNYYANESKHNPIHTIVEENGQAMLHMSSDCAPDALSYGDITLACDAPDISCQQYWYRGSWFDNLSTYWKDFTAFGALKNRIYGNEKEATTIDYSADDISTLAAHIKVKAGETKKVRFVMSWYMPYMNNTWDITNPALKEKEKEDLRKEKWKTYTGARYTSSVDSAVYAMKHYEKLMMETESFRDLLFHSTMPETVIDAISSTISVLKSPTCLRLTDGSFYGFEGVHAHEGSCEGTCTHVWSYTYAMAFLFPRLERSARTIEYKHSIQKDGGMAFRVQLPLGSSVSGFRPCVDGQYGTVMRVYREVKVSGDIEWLRSLWPEVKRTIEFAWSKDNVDKWDMDQDGILEGRQHHTLDMELFGPNAWLSGMYLGGLKAGAEMALLMEDKQACALYMSIYEKGVKTLNETLYNGKYFIQRVDLKDKSQLEAFDGDTSLSLFNESATEAYWNDEQSELKYQVGEGCLIDQVLGQWHSDILGLGAIFDEEKTVSALKSIYTYNYKKDMYGHFNPCRIYSLNDEGGTIMCSYPEDKIQPFIPVPYAEETMHGFEYQVASHMIKRGMVEEGLSCISAIRMKYDGERRNPWNEFECGSNYARSMASYALLLFYSGFTFDMTKQAIGFAPIEKPTKEQPLQFFWSLDAGWGSITIGEKYAELKVAYGSLTLKEVTLSGSLDGKKFLCAYEGEQKKSTYIFEKPIIVTAEKSLTIQWNESLDK